MTGSEFKTIRLFGRIKQWQIADELNVCRNYIYKLELSEAVPPNYIAALGGLLGVNLNNETVQTNLIEQAKAAGYNNRNTGRTDDRQTRDIYGNIIKYK